MLAPSAAERRGSHLQGMTMFAFTTSGPQRQTTVADSGRAVPWRR